MYYNPTNNLKQSSWRWQPWSWSSTSHTRPSVRHMHKRLPASAVTTSPSPKKKEVVLNNEKNKNINELNLAILTMQKNEDLLLEQWISYYSLFMPYKNICIVDNGSTNKNVIEILKKNEEKGVKVYYNYKSPQDFENKGEILKNIAQKLYSKCNYVFFLDADEFLYLDKKDEPESCDINEIKNYLLTLPKDKQFVYKINKSLINNPSKPNNYSKISHRKVFFRGGTIKNICLGFHTGECIKGNESINTSLGVVHFHNKPFHKKVEAAKEKMKLRVNLNDSNAIKNYTGKGVHLKEILLMTEEQYNKKYENNNLYFNPNFRNTLKENKIADISF
jgi:hypothetical protein